MSRHIIAKHVSDSAKNLIQKLRDMGRKRAATLKLRGLPQKEGEGAQEYKKGHLFIGRIISYPTMAADVMSASTGFNIFATRPVQTKTIEKIETAYKPIASLDQSDLEFLIPADLETYIDLNIHLFVRSKLTQADGTDLEPTDTNCVANNLLHTLFDQYNISLNGVTITHAADLYYYLAYLEPLLSYGNEAAELHLTNAFWYRDTGDFVVCNPTAAVTPSTNKGFLARYDRLKQSKEIEIMGRLYTEILTYKHTSFPASGCS